ncbi:hypothetical protein ABZ511_27355 [Nocardia gamkensis]
MDPCDALHTIGKPSVGLTGVDELCDSDQMTQLREGFVVRLLR